MFEIKLKVKKWGNSLGTIFPVNMVRRKKLKEGSSVDVLVPENNKVNLNRIFGTFKFKKSAQQLKDEMREGW